MPLLLPAVEEGIFADNWRIRQVGMCGGIEGRGQGQGYNHKPWQLLIRREA
jgi:hypothetical protein